METGEEEERSLFGKEPGLESQLTSECGLVQVTLNAEPQILQLTDRNS